MDWWGGVFKVNLDNLAHISYGSEQTVDCVLQTKDRRKV